MTDDQDANILIGNFLRTKDEERAAWLKAIQGRLPSWIRVYDQNRELHVYYDASAKTPLPKWLTFPANYVEAVADDGSAQVIKGGFGPTKLTHNTEPKALTALERLLGTDLI